MSSIQATMAVPGPLQGLTPPSLDTYWLPRGTAPLGTSALGSSITVDLSLVQLLLAQGFTISSWSAL
jgi:hypothetical protein